GSGGDAGEVADGARAGGVRLAQGGGRAGVRADQRGARLPPLLVARPEAGPGGMAAGVPDPQPPEDLALPLRPKCELSCPEWGGRATPGPSRQVQGSPWGLLDEFSDRLLA